MTVAGSQYFTTDQLARRYGMHPDSIRRWRYKGIGPEFYYELTNISLFLMAIPESDMTYHKVLAWEEANGITPIEPF